MSRTSEYFTETEHNYQRSEEHDESIVEFAYCVENREGKTSEHTNYEVTGQDVEMRALYDQVLDLALEVNEMKAQLANVIEKQLELGLDVRPVESEQPMGDETAINVREVPDEEAESLILEMFSHTEENLFYSDIASQLLLDLEQVVRVCEKLVEEDRIEFDD